MVINNSTINGKNDPENLSEGISRNQIGPNSFLKNDVRLVSVWIHTQTYTQIAFEPRPHYECTLNCTIPEPIVQILHAT